MVLIERTGSVDSRSSVFHRHKTAMDTLTIASCYKRRSLRGSRTFNDFGTITKQEEKVVVPRKLSDQPSLRKKSSNAPLIWVSGDVWGCMVG